MRHWLIAALALGAFVPRLAAAQSFVGSSVSVAHPTLALGQTEVLTIVARDLAGNVLPNAAVTVTLRAGSKSTTYHLKNTDEAGKTQLALKAPSGVKSGRVAVSVAIISGFLRQTVTTRFALSTKPARSAATPGSITPTPTAAETSNGLTVLARALPPHTVAPNPVYIVANALVHAVNQPGATVSVIATFSEGKVTVTSTTDAYGVATIKLDTARVRVHQVVKVSASVSWKGATSHGTTSFEVDAPSATSTPTVTPTAIPVAPILAVPTVTPTNTPAPVAAPVPTETPTAYPTSTPFPTPTPYPTPTDYPTSTPYPTYTPVPTFTAVPTDTPTPAPTNTATPTPNCPGSQSGCIQAMLNIINSTRSQYGLAPLALNLTQSNGTTSCAGSYGHSQAMAQSGYIWHTNTSYPAASFPNNVCVRTSSAGENVGQYSSGNELTDLQQIHQLMMNEAHDAATCASQINHACNLLSSSFQQVGIGIYFDVNRTWLTEDFLS